MNNRRTWCGALSISDATLTLLWGRSFALVVAIVGLVIAVPLPAQIITTAAGGGGGCANETDSLGDGCPATSAGLGAPLPTTFDPAGNLYIADPGDCVIRKVNGKGVITAVAGVPLNCGYAGDDGPATSAKLDSGNAIGTDSAGNLYIADYNNCLIREVSTGGEITTVAGVTTGAGTESNCNLSTDGGLATSTPLYYPSHIAVDPAGNFYFSVLLPESILKVNTAGIITTVAGGGTGCAGETDSIGDGCPATSASLGSPAGLALDTAGNLYIADSINCLARKVTPAGIITAVAGFFASNGEGGNTNCGYSGDGGAATAAELNGPSGIAVDLSGNLYIDDGFNCLVRKVSSTGVITTVAGVTAGAGKRDTEISGRTAVTVATGVRRQARSCMGLAASLRTQRAMCTQGITGAFFEFVRSLLLLGQQL